jgi:PAS domain S-box-containing protein
MITIRNDITERKRAEEALHRSEERWQLAATGTTDGIWDWDVAGHTVFLSARWKQLRGYREEEIGVDETEWSSRIHPEDSPGVMATLQSYFNKEIPAFHCEYRTRRKDGTYFWISDRGIAVWDAQGRVVRMVGSETDITERKRAEAELRHSEEQFRTVVESAPYGILSVDGGGRIVLVNGQLERQFGYRREELIGNPVETLLPGRLRGDHAGLREAYQEAPEVRTMGRGRDLYGLRKDGSEFPIEIGLSPIETISGTVVLASVVDITERKQREHALAEQRRLYKTVTDNAALALFIMDDSQQCVFMNPAAEALTGFALVEVMGRPLHDVVHHTRPDGSHYPLSECPIDQAFPKNDREQGEEIFVHKDGHFYSVAFTASPIRNELGQPVSTVIEVQDITERKRAELALQQNQMLLNEKREELQVLTDKLFTAQDTERQRIARDLHDDFSQRLVAVALDLEDLGRNPPLLPDAFGRALEPIREQLAQLSDDLRNLAHRLHPSLLKHAGLQAALDEHVHQAMKRCGLDITLKVRNVPDSLSTDVATCLFRVFQECLQNVAKHANATEVLVKLSGSSKGIGLSVTDNGTGFAHQDKSSHQKGLGLTSMRERLRLLNGFLNIHSRPAEGTKVCAWIPSQEQTP